MADRMTAAEELDAAISDAYILYPHALVVLVKEDGETLVLGYNDKN